MREITERRESMKSSEVRDAGFQLLGWILFVVCAICFIASSLNNKDLYSFAGSIVFLIACVIFIIPLSGKYQHLKRQSRMY